jgi:uncharacterized protein (DUF58 family)
MRFGWAQVGDRLEERFTITNTGLVPGIWVEINDYSSLPEYQTSMVTAVGGNSENQWHTHGLCTQRGLFTLGPTGLKTSDPFGIYSVNIFDPASRSLMVMPPVVPLPPIEVAHGGIHGEGKPLPNAPERSISSGSVREFVPGDSMRWIHWRTSARKSKPFVRIFDGTPAGDWHIILDMNQEAQVGEGWDSTVEHSVILAASLADRGLRLQRSVGLIANSRDLVWLHPGEGEGQRWAILRSLALIEESKVSLQQFLTQIQSDIRTHTSIIIITPATKGDWLEALLPLVWRGITPTVLLFDPISFGGSASTKGITRILSNLGITYYIITKDLIDKPEARPGQKGHWEWVISPQGRAVPIRKPSDTAWKVLS